MEAVQEFLLNACVCEEIATYLSVDRLLCRSGFGDSFSCVDDADSKNIHEVIFLGRGLMCNDAAVCGGRIDLKIVARDLSERCK